MDKVTIDDDSSDSDDYGYNPYIMANIPKNWSLPTTHCAPIPSTPVKMSTKVTPRVSVNVPGKVSASSLAKALASAKPATASVIIGPSNLALVEPQPSTSAVDFALAEPQPSTSAAAAAFALAESLPSTSDMVFIADDMQDTISDTDFDSQADSKSPSPDIPKTQTEILRDVVSRYLRRRNYLRSEAYENGNLILTQNKVQFVFNRMIEDDLYKGNTFLYSNAISLPNNPGLVDLHFMTFVQFVENQPLDIYYELSNLFGPLMCHLYLELLKGKDSNLATQFLRKYAPLVANIDENYVPNLEENVEEEVSSSESDPISDHPSDFDEEMEMEIGEEVEEVEEVEEISDDQGTDDEDKEENLIEVEEDSNEEDDTIEMKKQVIEVDVHVHQVDIEDKDEDVVIIESDDRGEVEETIQAEDDDEVQYIGVDDIEYIGEEEGLVTVTDKPEKMDIIEVENIDEERNTAEIQNIAEGENVCEEQNVDEEQYKGEEQNMDEEKIIEEGENTNLMNKAQFKDDIEEIEKEKVEDEGEGECEKGEEEDLDKENDPTVDADDENKDDKDCSEKDDDNYSETSESAHIHFTTETTGNCVRDSFKPIIEELSKCKNFKHIKYFKKLVKLRSTKFRVDVTSRAVDALMLFLKEKGHIVVFNILHIWMHFNRIDIGDDIEDCTALVLNSYEPPELLCQSENGEGNPNIVYLQDDENTADQKKHKIRIHLRKVFYSNLRLLKAERPLRSIYISDPGKCFTSSSIDPNNCHLAAGFDNSIIKLWQLNTHTCCGKNLYRSMKNRTCGFEFSNIDERSEDSDSDYEYNSDMGISNLHKYDGKPVSYLLDYTRRQRRKKFKESRSSENSFNEFGGITLRGHNRGVTDVMFSSEYPLLFSTSKDKTMRAWKSSNFQTVAIFKGHNYPIWCVNESPLKVQVATGSRDLTARLWSLETEFPLITFVGHTQDVTCLSFHSNGAYLATGSADRTVRLWSVTTGRLLRVYSDCKLPIYTIALSPNGKLVAAGGDESTIRIFDLAAGKQLAELPLPDNSSGVSSVVWNANGNKIAACGDGSVHVWHVDLIDDSVVPKTNCDTVRTANYKKLSTWSVPFLKRSMKIQFDENDVLTCVGGN